MTKITAPITIFSALILFWYAGAYLLNSPQATSLMDPDVPHNFWAVVHASWSMDRPVLPTPGQILSNLYDSIFNYPLNSPRNFLLQAGYTAQSAITGLAIGAALGIGLAIGIVHSRVLDRCLMPWVIASQTIPILAIAPMVVVALGNIGFNGLLPKAAIVGYLSFFPITVGMVKGFRSADTLQLDLMHTYNASPTQTFFKLRWPIAIAFLFPSLKVAVALAVTGAIVAEIPTGAQVGLGARLLAGSYYGQTEMMWGALILASALALVLIGCVRLGELSVRQARGGRL